MNSTTEGMIAFVKRHYAYLDTYYVVEKQQKRCLFFNRYRAVLLNPMRNKTISLRVWRCECKKLQLGDEIDIYDPLFVRVCKITHEFSPKFIRFYQETMSDRPDLHPRKFVDDLKAEAKKRGIRLFEQKREVSH